MKGVINITGGYSNKQSQNGVGGCNKGDLKPVQILSHIRQAYRAAVADPAAVGEDHAAAVADPEDVDPMELSCQGVDEACDTEEAALVANCPAVADMKLEWDFNENAWTATFVAGPHEGMTRSMNNYPATR